jgi:hypothetical protein
VCYSGNKERRQLGKGFLINKKYKHLIITWKEYIGKNRHNIKTVKGDFNAKVGREQGMAPNVV